MSQNNNLQGVIANNAIRSKIVLIDDCEDMLDLQKMVLEFHGFDVFTAESATDAFKVLSKVENPDLILLDIQMQDMTGPEFLIQLEQRNPKLVAHVPIVFLTAMEEAPASKAVGFIKKPIDIDRFVHVVQKFIQDSQLKS